MYRCTYVILFVVALKPHTAEWGNTLTGYPLLPLEPLPLSLPPTDLSNHPTEIQVHGIMIYYPCFGMAPSFYGGSMDDYLRDSIPIEKDVEGLCDTVNPLKIKHTRAEGNAQSVSVTL
jgi:hypothetical protein